MKCLTNPRTRYTRPGNRAERYLYRGTNRYILLDEWKKRTACRIGKKRRSVYVIARAMVTLEKESGELDVPFRDMVSGTLDLYFGTMNKGYPIFYDYARLLNQLIVDWYYLSLEFPIVYQGTEVDQDMVDELRDHVHLGGHVPFHHDGTGSSES